LIPAAMVAVSGIHRGRFLRDIISDWIPLYSPATGGGACGFDIHTITCLYNIYLGSIGTYIIIIIIMIIIINNIYYLYTSPAIFFSHIIIKFRNKMFMYLRVCVYVCVTDHCYCATNIIRNDFPFVVVVVRVCSI